MKENNKKKIVFGITAIVILVIIVILLISSCNKKYEIELTVDNELFYSASIHKGDTLEGIKEPTKDGYTFDGWYVGDEKVDITKPITEDLQLEAKWSKNEYKVTFDADNGKDKQVVEVAYEGVVSKPKNPVKKGYKFVGWYVNDVKYDFSTKIINNINIIAKWEKITETTYKIEHYLMDLNGKYSDKATEVETIKGKIDAKVLAGVKEYVGFISPEVKEVTIKEDAKTIVKYYYARNKYNLTINGDKGIVETSGSGSYYYGEEVNIDYILKAGYSFKNYSEEVKDNKYTIINKDVVINISTEANKDTKYTIKHCRMDLEGKYSICEEEVLKGTTDTKVLASVKEYVGFTSPKEKEITINGNGETLLQYNYTRNKYKISVNNEGDAFASAYEVYVNDQLYDSNKEYYYEDNLKIVVKNLIEGVHLDSASEFTLKVDTKDNVINYNVSVNHYTVRFYNITKNKEEYYDQELEYFFKAEDAQVLKANEFIKEHYHLLGWSKDKNISKVEIKVKEDGTYTLTENLSSKNNDVISLYAIWEINHDKVILYRNDGTDDIHYVTDKNYNEKLIEENIPEINRTGYTIDGWCKDAKCENAWNFETDVMPDDGKGLELYAKWVPITYTLTFDKNESQDTKSRVRGEMAEQEFTYDKEGKLQENNYVRDGYEFLGWSETFDGNAIYNNDSSIFNLRDKEGSKTLYAIWKIIEYTVNYDLDEGKVETNPSTYTIEEPLVLANPSKTGYDFVGWEILNDGKENEVTMLPSNRAGLFGNLELKALYKAHKYEVIFDKNNGTGTIDNQEFTYGVEQALTKNNNQITREHYSFNGWNTLANGKGTSYEDGKIVKNLTIEDGGTVTLYAMWTPIEYTITYKKQYEYDTLQKENIIANETLTTTNKTSFNIESDNIILSDPNKMDGYTFAGWYVNDTDSEDNKISNNTINPNDYRKSITLIAKYSNNKYTISYDGNTNTNTSNTMSSIECYYNKKCTLTDNTYVKEYSVKYNIENTPTDKVTYKFASWTSNSKSYTNNETFIYDIVGNLNLTASWKQQPSNLREIPEKFGYTIDGWYNGESKVTTLDNLQQNLELSPRYTPITYNLTYKLDDSASSKTQKGIPYTYDSKEFTLLEKPQDWTKSYTVKYNYANSEVKELQYVATFDGWYIGENKIEDVDSLKNNVPKDSENITLVAHWNAKVDNIAEGKTLSEEEKTERYIDEYKFLGWQKDDGNDLALNETINSNLVVNEKYSTKINTDKYIQDFLTTINPDNTNFNNTFTENNNTINSIITNVNKKLNEVLTEDIDSINKTNNLLKNKDITITFSFDDTTNKEYNNGSNNIAMNYTTQNTFNELKNVFDILTYSAKKYNNLDYDNRNISSLFRSGEKNEKVLTITINSSNKLANIDNSDEPSSTYTITFNDESDDAKKKILTNDTFYNLIIMPSIGDVENCGGKTCTNDKNSYINSKATTHYEVIIGSDFDEDGFQHLILKYAKPDASLTTFSSSAGGLAGSGLKTAFQRILGQTGEHNKIDYSYFKYMNLYSKGNNGEMNTDIVASNVGELAFLGFGAGILRPQFEKAFGMKATDMINKNLNPYTIKATLVLKDGYALEDNFKYPLKYAITFEQNTF